MLDLVVNGGGSGMLSSPSLRATVVSARLRSLFERYKERMRQQLLSAGRKGVLGCLCVSVLYLYYLLQDRVNTRGWDRKMALAMDTCRRASASRILDILDKGKVFAKGVDKGKDWDKDKGWDKHCASSCTSVSIEKSSVSSIDTDADDDGGGSRGV